MAVLADIPTLIVDDQDDIRLLLRLVIDRANRGLTVVGEAASGREALEQAERFEPRVVVVDEMMPEMSGIETAALLRARRPSQILILCSAHIDQQVIARAREAGIDAWVPKDSLRDLPQVIRELVGQA